MVKIRPPAVIVPVRELVVPFVAALKATVPFPEPLAPLVTVIQLAPLLAVHVHPAIAATENDPAPPAAATDWLVGDSEYEHDGAAAWLMVKVLPPAAMVPVRELVVVFAAALKATVPVPEPLVPLVRVIQLAPLLAVHVHPAVAVSENDPVPPSAATDCVVGERAYEHDGAAA
jgi:hypothetical protein